VIEQTVDRGLEFPQQRFVACVVVIIHQHLQPQQSVAGMKVHETGVIEDAGKLAQILARSHGWLNCSHFSSDSISSRQSR